MATIAEVRAADKKRKAQQAKDDAAAAAEIAAIRARNKKPTKKKSKSFLDKIREALGTEEASADAIAAIESGIAEADKANKDKK